MLLSNPTLSGFISIGLALLVGMTFHEYMHNYVAWLMGDNTPAYEGRLTLDPRKHINWLGWLMFVIIGFGILGTAPINPNAMRNPRVAWGERLSIRQRFGLSVLAGPVGNLIIAAAAGVLIRVMAMLVPEALGPIANDTMAAILPSFGTFLLDLVFWNVLLFFFNLIPLGGLDGRYVLGMFIPPQTLHQYENFQNQYGMYVLLGLIMLSFVSPSFNIFGQLIGGPTNQLTSSLIGQRAVRAIVLGI